MKINAMLVFLKEGLLNTLMLSGKAQLLKLVSESLCIRITLSTLRTIVAHKAEVVIIDLSERDAMIVDITILL